LSIESFRKKNFIMNRMQRIKFFRTMTLKKICNMKNDLEFVFYQISTATTCAFLIAKVFHIDVCMFDIFMYYLY